MPQAIDTDVLILGAGAAGLSAARELSTSRRVIVLEARDRVGGRLHTVHHANHPLPIELGPEFVHGHMPETFSLLGAAGLIAYDVTEKHDTMRRGKLVSQAAAWAKAEKMLERLQSIGRHDLSFEDFLKQHARRSPPAARVMARSFVEGFNAADARQISCRSLAKAGQEESKHEDGDKQYRLVGGYNRLAELLACSVREPSRIELSTIVQTVRWKRGEVVVKARGPAGDLTFRTPRAIVAVPLGVLQAPADARGRIAFEPDLPMREAIDTALVMGNVVKLTIRFRSPFWEPLGHKDLAFVHRADLAFPTFWSTLPLRTNVLTAWAGGPAADRVAAHGDLTAQAIGALAALFEVPQARIAREVERVDHHDWAGDPFSRGAYSYARVGGADVPERLARPIMDTLYFAGEHTHGGLLGTVAGAIHSGTRAAKTIRRTLSS
jgi:monoamine oxidase